MLLVTPPSNAKVFRLLWTTFGNILFDVMVIRMVLASNFHNIPWMC